MFLICSTVLLFFVGYIYYRRDQYNRKCIEDNICPKCECKTKFTVYFKMVQCNICGGITSVQL